MAHKSMIINDYIPMAKLEKMSYKELKEAGLIRETRVLYHQLKEETDALKKQGKTIEAIKQKLSAKYYVSPATVHGILYRPIGAR